MKHLTLTILIACTFVNLFLIGIHANARSSSPFVWTGNDVKMIAPGNLKNKDGDNAIFGDVTASDLANNSVDSANIVNGSVTSLDISDGTITGNDIADGGIVNADISASANISGTKVDPDFGSKNIETSGYLDISGTTIWDGGAAGGGALKVYREGSTQTCNSRCSNLGNCGCAFVKGVGGFGMSTCGSNSSADRICACFCDNP